MEVLAGVFHIIFSFLVAFSAWKWGDWRNWQKYYPTILFIAFGNFVAAYLTFNYSLWVCSSTLLRTTIIEFIVACILIPSAILIFLPHYPEKNISKQIGYIAIWVVLFSLWEWISYQIGACKYYNGWIFWHSVIFNCVMFPLIRLHHRKPLWGLAVAIAFASFIVFYFEIPYSQLK